MKLQIDPNKLVIVLSDSRKDSVEFARVNDISTWVFVYSAKQFSAYHPERIQVYLLRGWMLQKNRIELHSAVERLEDLGCDVFWVGIDK